MVGTLIASGSGTGFSAGPGGSDYITHAPGGTAGTGSKTWTFEWTAPTAGTGNVTFYAAVNFSDNTNDQFNDVIVNQTHSVQEATVGISEAELASIAIYPNPVIDEIHVATKDVDEESWLLCSQWTGRKLLKRSMKEESL